jgi:hypothetical protein
MAAGRNSDSTTLLAILILIVVVAVAVTWGVQAVDRHVTGLLPRTAQ